MVFKGTSSREPGAIDAAIEGLGGELNARTGHNSTQFSTVVPSANWRKALEITGDLLQNATFRPADLDIERKVIHSEMAWADCDPVRSGYSDLSGVAFDATDPDRFSIMGPVNNLDRFTSDDLVQFFHRWYRPANITLVVAGDIKADEVAAEATRLFPVPKDRLAAPSATPASSGAALSGVARAPARSANQLADRSLATVFIGFPIKMAEVTDRLPAIDTLIDLLAVADQPQGRLQTALIEKRNLAVSVTAEFVPGTITGLLVLSATGAWQDARRLEESLIAEVHRLRDVPVTQEEVDEARLNAASGVNGGDGSLAGLAHRLANQDVEEIPHGVSDDYAGAVVKVTADDVNKLIDHDLSTTHYAVAVIGPPAAPRNSASAGQAH